MKDSMLTTIDNPYSPFTEFEPWYAFDKARGYNTPSYLARVCITSDELSEADQDLAIELAMDEIISLNPLGIYKKIFRDSEEE